jgi:metallophosphoesterase (TIGR03767 family)
MSTYRRNVSRRRFLAGASATAAAVALGLGDQRLAFAQPTARGALVAGTTLEQAATPTGSGAYRRLAAGPGWPLVVRTDLASGAASRDDRRTGLASFVQFTDLHLVDSESPMRFEYLARYLDSAHRPHETLTVRGASALVERVNSVARGPWTGLPFSLVMATGDNTDNHEHAELDWYLSVMSGGRITPSTGDPARYEGVQNSGSADYWQPGSAYQDAYKAARGFPEIPGFLDAAGRPFTAPGLRVPWYTTIGNHDDSIVGTLPDLGLLGSVYTGGLKLEGADDADAAKLADLLRTDPGAAALLLVRLLAEGPVRHVTPDPRRAPFTTRQFAQAHLDPAYLGPGPAGHGFTSDAVAADELYYTFPVSDGVLGVSMDTTNTAGWADGSMGTAQLAWLERLLQANSSRWYDADGNVVRGTSGANDRLVVVFSHHTSGTMGNLLPDPRAPFEGRHDGATLVALLQRYPNVVAWVNGHTHENQIIPHPHAVPERAFWEINTASHIDYPQHARVIEIADNHDGTLSLFTTLLESNAPYATDFGTTTESNLAALYRELSYNDPYAHPDKLLGTPADHNTELLLARPA